MTIPRWLLWVLAGLLLLFAFVALENSPLTEIAHDPDIHTVAH